jgi:glucarate dehydratase
MAPSQVRITGARVTPVAFVDPPLLNTVGVHQPYALRAIIQLDTDAGLVGLGETYADQTHLARLEAAADAIAGLDVFSLNTIRAAIAERLRGNASDAVGTAGMITSASTVDQVFSPIEVACLDVQGHATGRPVSDLLGGTVRHAVPFSAYLFYKLAAHPGGEPDTFGEALDPDAIVIQARRIIGEYGFTAIKLKGGVFPPEEEMAAIEALRAAFPDHPLRLDPNAAWTPQTSVKVASGLAGILEYLEDPTPGLDGMADVAQQAPMPLATNMCVVAFDHLAPAVAKDSVRVVLSDHHYWGGLQRSRLLPHLRDLRPRAVDALQLPPRHQPCGDGAPRRSHTQPHLRVRHPLAVEDRGDRQTRQAGVRRRLGGRAYDAGPRRGDRRGCAGRLARAVPALRHPRRRRHRLHEEHRPRLRGDQPALVGPLAHRRDFCMRIVNRPD